MTETGPCQGKKYPERIFFLRSSLSPRTRSSISTRWQRRRLKQVARRVSSKSFFSFSSFRVALPCRMILPALTIVPRYAHTGRKKAPLISIPQTFQMKKPLVFSQVCPSCPSCLLAVSSYSFPPSLLPRPTLYPLGFLCAFALYPPKSFRLWTLLLQDTLVQCVHFFWVVGLPTQAFVSAVANEGRDPFTAQTLDIISDDSGKNDVILMIHKVIATLFVLPVSCISLASRCPSSLSIHPIRIFGPCQGFPFRTYD